MKNQISYPHIMKTNNRYYGVISILFPVTRIWLPVKRLTPPFATALAAEQYIIKHVSKMDILKARHTAMKKYNKSEPI